MFRSSLFEFEILYNMDHPSSSSPLSSETQQEAKNNQDEKYYEKIFGTKVITGPLALKKPLVKETYTPYEQMTDAQRSAEAAKEKRALEIALRSESYEERISKFNKKLAKETEHNEMPRISGQ